MFHLETPLVADLSAVSMGARTGHRSTGGRRPPGVGSSSANPWCPAKLCLDQPELLKYADAQSSVKHGIKPAFLLQILPFIVQTFVKLLRKKLSNPNIGVHYY